VHIYKAPLKQTFSDGAHKSALHWRFISYSVSH